MIIIDVSTIIIELETELQNVDKSSKKDNIQIW